MSLPIKTSSEAGVSLVELVVALAAISLLVQMTVNVSGPWLARESARSAVYDVQVLAQLARAEASARNENVVFEIDTDKGRLRVLDTAGPTVLHERAVSSDVEFLDPAGGTAVTMTSLGSSKYRVIFAADGTVQSGQGSVSLYGGQAYKRIVVYAAGGVEVQHWNGHRWGSGA